MNNLKITLDIPKDFEQHFSNDRFKDSLKRIQTDVLDEIESDFSISGKYELEVLEMLLDAFKNAEIISSEYKPRLTAKWDINCDGYYPYCTNCMNEPPGREMTEFCPRCGAYMRGDKNE